MDNSLKSLRATKPNGLKQVIEMQNARLEIGNNKYWLYGYVTEHPKLGKINYPIQTSPIIEEHSDKLFETKNTIYNVVSWATK